MGDALAARDNQSDCSTARCGLGNGTGLRHWCRSPGTQTARTMLRPLTALLVSLLLLGAAVLHAAEPTAYRTLAGEIEGARWTALVPGNWDGRLLLEAPDCRRAPAPLAAALDPTDLANAELLTAGWALATTSYRRHGPLLADGIEDLRALRDHLVEALGQPKLTLVEGTGMGGLIATLIAERHADEFHGCIAHDPQLDLRDPRSLRLRCDHQPRAALLFLTSPDTADPIQEYIGRARTAANAESIVPVLWFVPAEAATDKAMLHTEALAAMEEWARTRQPPAARPAPAPPAVEAEAGPTAVPVGGTDFPAAPAEKSENRATPPAATAQP